MFNKELVFSNPSWNKCLSFEQVRELLAKEIWLGDELEVHGDDLSQDDMRNELDATRSYKHTSKYNVVDVVTDGSVNGLEILTMARQSDPICEYEVSEKLFGAIGETGYWMGRECGWHTHAMVNTNQEMKIPQVVFRNFVQLFRLFFPAMVMLTKSTSRGLHQYSRLKPIMGMSGLNKHNGSINKFQNVGRYLAINVGQKGYYSEWEHRNLQPLSGNGDMKSIHWEIRIADSHFSPAILVAYHDILRTLIRKSIEFSEHGILKISSTESDSLCEFDKHKKLAKFWDHFNYTTLNYWKRSIEKITNDITLPFLMEYTAENIDLLLDLFGEDFHEITTKTLIKTKTKPYLLRHLGWDKSIKYNPLNLDWYKSFRNAIHTLKIKATDIRGWWKLFRSTYNVATKVSVMKTQISKEGYKWNTTIRQYTR